RHRAAHGGRGGGRRRTGRNRDERASVRLGCGTDRAVPVDLARIGTGTCRLSRRRRVEVLGDLRIRRDGSRRNSAGDVSLAECAGGGTRMRSGRRGRLQRALHGVTVGGSALAGVSVLVAAANSVFVPRLNRGGAAGVHESAGVHERVAVCVPARNEEATLPVLVTDLRAQTYPGPLKLLILDDDSDDRTATVASEAAAGDP